MLMVPDIVPPSGSWGPRPSAPECFAFSSSSRFAQAFVGVEWSIMLTFSSDGPTADKQMRAVIFYLTTFGYIDGDFDASEKEFVRDYVRKLVAHRVEQAGLDGAL